MIYIDSSVALAHLLSEGRRPRQSLWQERLVASRLLAYEMWTRLHAYGADRTVAAAAHGLLAEIDLLEMTPQVLARALEPMPVAVRTLDALHLASIAYLRERGIELALATYDARLRGAAKALGFELHEL